MGKNEHEQTKIGKQTEVQKNKALCSNRNDERGWLLDPYGLWGCMVRNNIFYSPEVYPEYQFILNPPKERIFSDVTQAAMWIERNYSHYAANHFLKNIGVYR